VGVVRRRLRDAKKNIGLRNWLALLAISPRLPSSHRSISHRTPSGRSARVMGRVVVVEGVGSRPGGVGKGLRGGAMQLRKFFLFSNSSV